MPADVRQRRVGSPEAPQQPVALRLEATPSPLLIRQRLPKASHVGGRHPSLVPFEGPTHRGVPLGIVVQVHQHFQLGCGEALLLTQTIDLIGEVEEAVVESAHEGARRRYRPGCAGMAEW